MADPNSPHAHQDGPPPAPRWVKVSAIIAILLILTAVIVHLAGGGFGHHSGR